LSTKALISVGIVLVVYGLLISYFFMSLAWGGFLSEPLMVRAIGFGSAAAISMCGVAALSLGSYRLVCRRSRSN
jgi:hypothetical protein